MWLNLVRSLSILFVLALAAGCGGGTSNNISSPQVMISISLASVTLPAGGTQTFSATVQNATDTGVTWLVNGVVGGSSSTGTISSTGTYTAPAVQSQTTFTVTAVADANTSIMSSATVTVTPLVKVTVSPQSAGIETNHALQLSASVVNTTNTAVVWQVNGVVGGNATAGTITVGGLYTAPAALPPQNPVTVTAVSVADVTKSDSASIIISVTPIVSVNPTQAMVVINNQQQFTATVSGPSNMAVTWTISGAGCSGATCGAITTGGLYTAPSAVPSPATVTVTATSQADGTTTGTATVTVIAHLGLTISPSGPLHVALSGQQMFTATVVGDPLNQGVNWTLACTSDAEGGGFHDCVVGSSTDDAESDKTSLIGVTTGTTSITLQAPYGFPSFPAIPTSCDEGVSCSVTLTATTVAFANGSQAVATVTIMIP